MRFRPLLCIFSLILAAARPVFAGNEHEHFSYYPTHDDLNAGFHHSLKDVGANRIIGGTAENVLQLYGDGVAKEFLTSDQLAEIYAIEDKLQRKAALNRYMNKSFKNQTIEQVTQRIQKHYLKNPKYKGPRDYSVFERSLFEYIPDIHRDSFEAYLALSKIRNSAAFKNKSEFTVAMENAIRSRPSYEVIKTSLSVPANLYEPVLLNRLSNAFERRGGKVEFFYSIPRRFLWSSPDQIEKMASLVKPDALKGTAGIDISGSITEMPEFTGTTRSNSMAKNLKTVFKFGKENNLPIRIHAFEANNAGDFYASFWEALRDCKREGCLPKDLRIGHINKLSYRDILRFKEFKDMTNLTFEFNLSSNEIAQNTTFKIENAIETIDELRKNNFKVALGADGYGILGEESSFLNTLKRLKKSGMGRKSLAHLIEHSTNPNFNQKLLRSEQVIWSKIQSRLEYVVNTGRKKVAISDQCLVNSLRTMFSPPLEVSMQP